MVLSRSLKDGLLLEEPAMLKALELLAHQGDYRFVRVYVCSCPFRHSQHSLITVVTIISGWCWS